MSSTRDLARHLLAPQSVAIVGQSNDAGKTAGRPLKYLRQAGYAGRVYPVNARRDEVLGERAWPSLAALPEVPEHVYVVTPTGGAMEAIEECARLGVPVVTALANGFSEAGEDGEAREARLREIAAASRTRIVGPSSLGVVDLRHKTMLTANAAFDEKDVPVGRVFAASHSGGMIGTFLSRGKARGIGYAAFVSVGNEVDLSIGEICAATLDDPGIDGYVLFLETLRKADALRAFALEAAKRQKPVMAFKLGRSAAARELAVTHTGALAGEDDIAAMFLAECGIARVDTLEGLIEGFALLARMPQPARAARQPTVAVVTTTAGGAAMVVDALGTRGIAVEPPSEDTLRRIKAASGIAVAPARLIDMTLAGAQYAVMKGALDVLTSAPEFDLVVPVIGSSARFYPDLAVKPIVDSAGAAKPIAAFLVPDAPDALARLSAAGVPNFHTPEACADAIAAVLKRRPPRVLPLDPHPDPPPFRGREKQAAGAASPQESAPAQGNDTSTADSFLPLKGGGIRTGSAPGRTLDELEAYALLDRLGVPRAPSVALDRNIETAPALPFPYPVAVKALSVTLTHKSDAGGVILNVHDAAELMAAVRQIERATKANRVLVQPMMAGVGEVLIGYRVDRDVGALVMLAAGGILAEIHRDRSLRLAPVDPETAREMIGEVAALKALAGYRGKPAGDLDALAQGLVALSRLAVTDGDAVAEAEVNPLVVRPRGQGVVAVDALVRLA